MNTQSLFKHTGLAFTFVLSSVILSKLLPNNIELINKYDKDNIETLGSFEVKKPTLKFGLAIDTFSTEIHTVESGETLASILNLFTPDRTSVYNIIEQSKGAFNPRHLKPGMEMTVLKNKISGEGQYLVLQPDVYKYIVYDLKNPENLKIINRPVETTVEVVSGLMEGSLWATIKKYNMDTNLASQIEDALETALDLSRAGKGDQIKIVYEKNTVEGEEVKAGKVLAAYYKGKLGEKYVFNFDNGKYSGYFDQEGRPMKRSWLKSPVKYARITSGFSKSRLHPVLNRVIPHLGTDFAAPHGTPILSVSDGIIEEMGYNSGNGYYVKVKHDKSHATQYLHMSRFAKGQKKGQRVAQGQVIGYVGSTGLATGPHVCFRFWKNGKQVNPKYLKLPAAEPIPGASLEEFKKVRNDMMLKLAAIGKPIPGEKVIRMDQDSLIILTP